MKWFAKLCRKMANDEPNPFYLAAYLRDSGGEEQDLSLDQQEIAVRRWCAERGFVLVRIFRDEARPGSSAIGREGFQRMMEHFRSEGCQEAGIVIWKYSRFARDIDDAQFYRADLRRRGYRVISINDTIPDGPEGRFFEAAIDWMNQRFLEDLSSDVRRGLRHLVETYGAIPGKPPRGFKREAVHLGQRRDGSSHTVHRWIIDPETAPIVQRAFELRAHGASLAQINAELHLFGSLNSYLTFFTNRLYIGELRFGELVIPDYCQPLVDPQTWEAVQRRIRSHAAHANLKNGQHPRRAASPYLLSGLAHCARCGAPLYGHSAFQRNGSSYQSYACTRAKRRRDCDAPKIPRAALEKIILNELGNYILTPAMLQELQSLEQHSAQDRQAEIDRQTKILRSELGSLRRKIANITHLAEEGQATRALIQRQAQLETDEADLLARLEQLTQDRPDPAPPMTFEEITAMSTQLIDQLKQKDPAQIRPILQGLIHRITVERDGKMLRGLIEFYLPKRAPPDTVSISRAPVGAPIHRHSFQSQYNRLSS